MDHAAPRAEHSDQPINTQHGIAQFVAASKGFLALLGFMEPKEDMSARARAFQLAMDSALSRVPPDMQAIANAPSWLALPVSEQVQLIMAVGAVVHAPALAVSLNGTLLHDIAALIGEAKLDHILHTVDPDQSKDQQDLTLQQIKTDGQSILLATLQASLRAPLMEGNYFKLTDANMIEKWQPHAKNILAQAENV